MNFKKACVSAIEPILFAVVLFLAVLAVAALCSPINKDQRFSLIPAHSLKAEVRVKDLQLRQVFPRLSKINQAICVRDFKRLHR